MRFGVVGTFTLEHITLCHILGLFVSACLLPYIVDSKPAEKEDAADPARPPIRNGGNASGIGDGLPRRGQALRHVVAVAIVLFVLAGNFPGVDWRFQGVDLMRYLNVFSLAMLCPLVYGYFFALTPQRRQGVAFGAALFLGAVTAALILSYGSGLFGGKAAVSPEELRFFSRITFVLLILLAMVLFVSLLGGSLSTPIRAPLFLCDAEPERRRAIALIIAAGLVYSLINELNQVQFFPILPDMPTEGYHLSALYLFCPLVGWYLDRYPLSSFQPLIQLCAAIFMLTPALMVTSPVSQAHWGVDLAVYMAMHATNIAIVVTLVRLVRFGRGYFLALSLLYGLQMANNALNGAVREHLAQDTGVLVLVCILTVMLFYILVKNINVAALPKAETSPRVGDYSGVSFMEVANRQQQVLDVDLYAQLSAAAAIGTASTRLDRENVSELPEVMPEGVSGKTSERALERVSERGAERSSPKAPEEGRAGGGAKRKISEDSTVIIAHSGKIAPVAPSPAPGPTARGGRMERDTTNVIWSAAANPGAEPGGSDETEVILQPAGGSRQVSASDRHDDTETSDLSDLIDAADSMEARSPTDTSDTDVMFLKKELTRRESDTAYLIIKGLTNREIAEIMGISEHTVANHVKQVLRKFGVPSRKSLMAMFIGKGEEAAGGDKGTAVEPASSRAKARESVRDAALQDDALYTGNDA